MESGLLVALECRVGPGGRLMDKGPHVRDWNRSMGQLYLNNGSVVYIDGGDDGALRIQGKNLRGCWVDEVGLLLKWETAWDESIKYAVRLGPAKIIVTGTPKAYMPARKLVKRLLEDDAVVKSLVLMEDNIENLHRSRVRDIMALRGTRLGRQEVMGELLEDVPGALWTLELIERDRCLPTDVPEMVRIIVGVDPAVTAGENSDATGIVVVGKGTDGRGYVLGDYTVQGVSPATWGRQVIKAYNDWEADRVVAEVNNGGDLVIEVLRGIDSSVPCEKVTASRGKIVRAEPVSAAYELGLVSHAGEFPELEDEMTTYQPDPPDIRGEKRSSPDRMDALVWACRKLGLMVGGEGWGSVYEAPEAQTDEDGDKDKERARRGWGSTYAAPGQAAVDQEKPKDGPKTNGERWAANYQRTGRRKFDPFSAPKG